MNRPLAKLSKAVKIANTRDRGLPASVFSRSEESIVSINEQIHNMHKSLPDLFLLRRQIRLIAVGMSLQCGQICATFRFAHL